MKTFIIAIVIIISSLNLYTQEKTGEMETIFGDKEYQSGYYGCPEVKYTQFNDQMEIMVGGRGGWIINHTFSIGLAGYGLVTNSEVNSGYIPRDSLDLRPYYVQTGMGGIFLQYTYSSNSMIHFTVNSLIGAGGASYTPNMRGMNTNMGFDYNNRNYDQSAFFVFEPGIGVEMNIFRFFRVELGGSYRIISGLDLPKVDNSSFGGASVNLAFKFGNF